MSEHILSLPRAARVYSFFLMIVIARIVDKNFEELAEALHGHGYKDDRMESRRAFAEKRKPKFRGWNEPEDRYKMPKLK